MKDVLTRLLDGQQPNLNSCPVCPVKGTCVFVTPGFEPGYCLHEYKLLHAYLARCLREHPPAGASRYAELVHQATSFAAKVRSARPYDPSASDLQENVRQAWSGSPQAVLDAFLA